jgi:hypothetical protein
MGAAGRWGRLALLVAEIILVLVGLWIWSYRFHVHLVDPTSYNLNTDVTLAIVLPSLLALVLTTISLLRFRDTQQTRRKTTDLSSHAD